MGAASLIIRRATPDEAASLITKSRPYQGRLCISGHFRDYQRWHLRNDLLSLLVVALVYQLLAWIA